MASTGHIYALGTFTDGTGGVAGTVVYSTLTRIDALGDGWKKAYIASNGGALLHSDGRLLVTGYYSGAYWSPSATSPATYEVLDTGVDDIFKVGDANSFFGIVIRKGTTYYAVGDLEHILKDFVHSGPNTADMTGPHVLTTLAGLDVIDISGAGDYTAVALTSDGKLYVAGAAYRNSMTVSEASWSGANNNDGQFHQVQAGQTWKAAYGRPSYDPGVTAVNNVGHLYVSEVNDQFNGWTGSFLGYPTNTSTTFTALTTWPTMKTDRQALPQLVSSNGFFGYIGADGKLYTQALDNAVPAAFDSNTNWIGFANNNSVDSSSSSFWAIRGSGISYTAHLIWCNFSSGHAVSSVVDVPINTAIGSAVGTGGWRGGSPAVWHADLLMLLTPIDPRPPVFWEEFEKTHEYDSTITLPATFKDTALALEPFYYVDFEELTTVPSNGDNASFLVNLDPTGDWPPTYYLGTSTTLGTGPLGKALVDTEAGWWGITANPDRATLIDLISTGFTVVSVYNAHTDTGGYTEWNPSLRFGTASPTSGHALWYVSFDVYNSTDQDAATADVMATIQTELGSYTSSPTNIATPFFADAAYHVYVATATFDASTGTVSFRMFVDGAFVVAKSMSCGTSFNPTGNPSLAGGLDIATDTGSLDDFAFYNRVLTDDEIATLTL